METEKIKEEMEQLKSNIDKAKNNVATLDGREIEVLKNLKKEHGISSSEEIKKKIKDLQKESTTMETSIENDYKELREKYDW